MSAAAAPGAAASRWRDVTAPVLALGTYLRTQRRLFAEVVVVVWAALVTGVAVAVLSVRAATTVAVGDPAGLAMLALGVAVVAVGVLAWTEQWLAHVLAYRVIDSVRQHVHAAIARLAPLGLGRRRSGETVAAAMTDAEQLEWFYAHTAAQVVAGGGAALTVSAGAVAWLGPVGLVVPAAQLLVLAVPVLALPVASRQGTALRAEVAALASTVMEARSAARETVLLGRVPAVVAAVRAGTARVQRVRRGLAVRTGVEQAALEGVGAAAVLGTLALAVDGAVPAASVPAAVALAGAGLAPALAVVAGLQRLGETSAAAARVAALLRSPGARPADGPHADLAGSSDERGALQVRGLRVTYPGTDHAVLDGVDLDVRPGEHVAVVGASGAGKSTLALVLARLVGHEAGEVHVDGVRVADEPGARTRERVVLVGQHAHVFRASVRANLLAPDADDAALWRALEGAHLADRVRALPEGLDTVLAERGAAWSGGERQRLGLARGLLRDPSVLVLDEPTAGLDTRTEAAFLATLRAARRGRTTVVVTHRPAVVRACDRVVLLDGGRVVADGTHDSLVPGCARYREVLATPAGPGPDEHREEVTNHG
ncbi:ATP-binding cassette domain-containing protein [Cellulomonas sp. JZ18]|uniref:amino acid ABC transporter ATP-binding/permease protein n=1 Tax=Cellulomonas sp. JZ18 TaxID=2654191 RepID=UPI0012D44E8C|nr:ABC transporter ATP-binding protein [Cellulomonas sp. JZ18]QGQ19417.1 ATP-binding cassette domain-containing protein [Cellulomonas sp. JZ18]